MSRDAIMDLLKGHDWTAVRPLHRRPDLAAAPQIEENPDDPKIVKTVRGVGYVFAAETRPRQAG